ncbi:glycosyltransferase [Spelaeicoccus albus]|uniref:Putative flippase GtrA n=1 Tax=Spelaeicoccus albus TaxID=1280376 RepID=A0A7Z0D5X1_9MICO|nr:glycosyltransferase [Spelaeicoccus albus]NYI69331.1 putative flippase GtrA [Spelaeicoccus albus]
MTDSQAAGRSGDTVSDRAVTVDIALPVFNEQAAVEAAAMRLRRASRDLPYRVRIIIVDNASTDRTPAISRRLAERFDDVSYLRLNRKGRGRALKTAWQTSDADICAYMDVDLSTDLTALAPALAALASGHSDISIGSRLAHGARVQRGLKREFISRGYNTILKTALDIRYSDAQCGFKAVRRDTARALLPFVSDVGWFFDTELLTLAEWAGMRIHEIPVDWIDDPDSSVDIVATAREDLRGVVRMIGTRVRGGYPLREIADDAAFPGSGRRPAGAHRLPHQIMSFGLIGVLSTAAFALLFLLLAPALGAQTANFAALVITAIANTAANRRVTFGVRGRAGAARHQGRGLIVFGLGWALTSGALAALHTEAPDAGRATELGALVAANIAATAIRFLLLHFWVFGPREGSRLAVATDPPSRPPLNRQPVDDHPLTCKGRQS